MTKKPNYVFDDELYHHGILGQRWGHRRFQNEDGSWTPEGRERYGEGGARSKSDVQKYKAKVSYNTQKYKADLKSKAQRDKDKRAAKEERNRIREAEKTARVQKKEQAKTDTKGQANFKLGKTKNMSDEDLQKAVDRLKLQAEYNKSYVLATQPNSALAKADRFFSGPTGQMVQAVAVATVPKIAEQVAREASKTAFKYVNKKDRDKAALDIEEKKQTIASTKAKSDSELKDAELKRATDKAKSISEFRDAELKRKIDASNQHIALWEKKQEVERLNKQNETEIQIKRSEQAIKAAKARLDMKVENIKQFGGLEYTDSKGTKYKTSGLIVENDLQKQLETIKLRKNMGFW